MFLLKGTLKRQWPALPHNIWLLPWLYSYLTGDGPLLVCRSHSLQRTWTVLPPCGFQPLFPLKLPCLKQNHISSFGFGLIPQILLLALNNRPKLDQIRAKSASNWKWIKVHYSYNQWSVMMVTMSKLSWGIEQWHVREVNGSSQLLIISLLVPHVMDSQILKGPQEIIQSNIYPMPNLQSIFKPLCKHVRGREVSSFGSNPSHSHTDPFAWSFSY